MLRLPRNVWIRLGVLAVITALFGGLMVFTYMQVPANLFGLGRYSVTVNLPSSGGLYPRSVVNYRGTQVGEVDSVEVTRDGVKAVLSLHSDQPVPADVEAAVHSRSAIGEQYIEFVPRPGANANEHLRAGDVIPAGQVEVPVDIGGLLDATNRALKAIPNDNLRTVIDESYKAVGGLGPELSRLVDGSTALAIEGGRTVDPLSKLIDEAPPVLDSQVQTADSIATWADRMAAITGQLKAQDTAFRDLLTQGGPALEQGRALFDRLAPALPVLLANLVSLGEIAVTYRADLEQLLVLFPQGVAVMGGAIVPNTATKQDYRGIYLDFNLNLNLPPPCTTGFLPAKQRRSPALVDAPDRPAGDLYCRLPQDSAFNVRGARNIPCEASASKRAPTVEMCESDQPYVPLNDGFNWKGDPNATLSGQDVPQPPADTAPPPQGVLPPSPIATTIYDPATGEYIGPDGRRHVQGDLVTSRPHTWQSMLVPPGTA
ncbi:MCE family protein [Mycolicibacterium moriokaense]|nr:MCE family protein [Mycolicibacterium moriokaense]